MNLNIDQFRDAILSPMALRDGMTEKISDGTNNFLYYRIKTLEYREALDKIAKKDYQDISNELIRFNSHIFNLLNDSILVFNFCCNFKFKEGQLEDQEFMNNLVIDLQHLSNTHRLIKKLKLTNQHDVALRFLNYFQIVFEDAEEFLRTTFFIDIDKSPLKFTFNELKVSFRTSILPGVQLYSLPTTLSDTIVADSPSINIKEAIEDHLCIVEDHTTPSNFKHLKEALFVYFTTEVFPQSDVKIIFNKRCAKKLGGALGCLYKELKGKTFDNEYLLFLKNNVNLFMHYPLDLNNKYNSNIYKYLSPVSTKI